MICAPSQQPESATALDALKHGGKRAIADALARVECAPDASATVALVDAAYLAPHGAVIGFTGPPGVGKSTLIDALIKRWRAAGVTVGVIAVDPSSRTTHGALLGDRIRMRTDPADDGVFVRSLASRGALGGLAELAFPAAVLMRALFDRVVVETVGVGQSEADISAVADSVVLCVQPGSGDALQFMKAGIMEIPDLAAVTKADMGASARRALADLKGALGLASSGGIPCHMVSATKDEGVGELLAAIDARFPGGTENNCELATRRHAQAESWLRLAVGQRFGEAGLAAAETASAMNLPLDVAPFGHARDIMQRLTIAFDA
ncbi:MAG: methylmalonyl Co-A mutase-associated GTPase MeaB [Alphaproteobacteria bacterium]